MRQHQRFFVVDNTNVVFSVLLFVAVVFSTVANAFESPAKSSLKAFEVVTFSKVETTRTRTTTTSKSSLTSSPDDDID